MKVLNGLFVLSRQAYEAVYAPSAAAAIASRVNLVAPPQTASTLRQNTDLLANVDVIFAGWGMPRLDSAFLDAAPKLQAVFYGAGAINSWCTPSVWERGVVVTCANDANAIPVADYTVATALFSLKSGWRLSCGDERTEGFRIRRDIPGNYKATVGLVGMGTIARLVVDRLRPFGMCVLAYDPYLTPAQAAQLGVVSVSLTELFEQSDVVSLHAPDVPATRGMIGRDLLQAMKRNATFINTARGRVVQEAALAEVLAERPDLYAVLDVTEVEPLPASSPLRGLNNLTLTPHIAGSQGRECQRMGQYMVDELDRYLAGVPLLHEIRPSVITNTVHHVALPDTFPRAAVSVADNISVG